MQGFDPQKPLSAEIRLHLAHHLDAAIVLLEEQAQGRDHAIHKARKQLKAARAALKLTRDLSPKRFKLANKRLGIAARSIAGARDAAAMIECANWLEPYFAKQGSSHLLQEMTARLEAHYIREVELAKNLEEKVASAITLCRITLTSLQKAKKSGKNKAAPEILAAGWVRRHKAAVKALAACQARGMDEDFHDLRKATQQTIYQTRLLERAWPSGISALETEAQSLAKILGNEHDMTMLIALGSSEPDALCAAEARQQLLDLLEKRRAELRKHALKIAKQLFAGYWKNEGKRIRKLWGMMQ